MNAVAAVLGIMSGVVSFYLAAAGGAVQALGSGVRGAGTLATVLVFAIPLGNFIGGGLAFARPLIGGIVMLACALAILVLGINKYTVWSLTLSGCGAILGIGWGLTAQGRQATPRLAAAPGVPLPPMGAAARGRPGAEAAAQDVARWKALLEYDADIAQAVARIAPFGQDAVDELARAWLAINDKAALPAIVDKIIADRSPGGRMRSA